MTDLVDRWPPDDPSNDTGWAFHDAIYESPATWTKTLRTVQARRSDPKYGLRHDMLRRLTIEREALAERVANVVGYREAYTQDLLRDPVGVMAVLDSMIATHARWARSRTLGTLVQRFLGSEEDERYEWEGSTWADGTLDQTMSLPVFPPDPVPFLPTPLTKNR